MADWNENARQILAARYLARDKQGNLIETPDQMLERVAKAVSFGEKTEYLQREYYEKFLGLMDSLEFLPNSPALINAGRELGQLAACFVLPIGDNIESIFEMVKQSALIHRSGGGTGFNFSSLRPEGTLVGSTQGVASGPISFMSCFDKVTETVKQGGVRRGANMGILNISHPDIMKFIECKNGNNEFQNFNLSVALDGEFLSAVKNNGDVQLAFHGLSHGVRIKAADIFDRLCQNAWSTGEPGVLFMDTINKANPTPWLGRIFATNPCLSGDTLVPTGRGLIPLRDVVAGDAIATGASTLGVATAHYNQGVKGVVRVVTRSGFSFVCTPDHKVLTEEGMVPAVDLVGKKIKLQPTGAFGTLSFDATLTELAGYVIGDGYLGKDRYVCIVSGLDGDELVNHFGCLSPISPRALSSSQTSYAITFRDPAVRTFMLSLGVTRARSYAKEVPPQVLRADKQTQAAFLRGLFSADGSVWGNSKAGGVSISLSTKSEKLARVVQVMLMNFGIRALLHMHEGKISSSFSYVTKRGELHRYLDKPFEYGLVISSESRELFMREVGFLLAVKTAKYQRIKPNKQYRQSEFSLVTSVEPAGQEEVFDVTEPSNHTFIANGVVVSNCGESPLLPWESCNLGSMDISKFVTEKKKIDFDKLRAVVQLAVRFLDNIVEVNKYPRIQIARKSRLTRKVGLGVMGWADTLGKMGVEYDSPEALDLAEKVIRTMKETAYLVSRELGREKGVCFKSLKRRNACLITIAPTGTLSILAGCSNGIEPIFSRSYTRDLVNGMKLEFGTEYNVKTALEISPENHVRMQAAFQKHTDQAVSKTINLPETASVGDVKNAFLLAYELGCKGLTVYRQGTREAPYQEISECSSDKCLV